MRPAPALTPYPLKHVSDPYHPTPIALICSLGLVYLPGETFEHHCQPQPFLKGQVGPWLG